MCFVANSKGMHVGADLEQSHLLVQQSDPQVEKVHLGQHTFRLQKQAMSVAHFSKTFSNMSMLKQKLAFGKLRTAARLVRMLPAHRTAAYVWHEGGVMKCRNGVVVVEEAIV